MIMDFNEERWDTVTNLSIAARNGNEELAEKCLLHGSKPDLPDNRGWTAIHFAAFYGRLEILKRMLLFKLNRAEYLSNLLTWNKESPLMLACNKTDINVDIVSVLIANGAKVNETNNEGYSALHLACSHSNNLHAVKYLFSKGADVQLQEEVNGYTPLLFAIEESGDDMLVRYLVSVSNLSIRPPNNMSILFFACSRQNIVSVEEILKRTTDDIDELFGHLTPLSISLYVRSWNIVDILLSYGANPNISSSCNLLPLFFSIPDPDTFKKLLPLTDEVKIKVCVSCDLCCSDLAAAVILSTDNLECYKFLQNYPFVDKTIKEIHILDVLLYFKELDEINSEMVSKFVSCFKYYLSLTPDDTFLNLMLLISFNEIKKFARIINVLFKFGVQCHQTMLKRVGPALYDHLLDVIKNQNSAIELKLIAEEILCFSEDENPLTLKQLSRLMIRRYIKSLCSNNYEAYMIVQTLPIPPVVKKYLLFEC